MQDTIGPLALFAAAMTLTPGPNVVLVTASGANFGFRRTIPQMCGITLGFGLMVIAAGLGIAGLLRSQPGLHPALKYLGAAYLLYLAWRIARAGSGGGHAAQFRPIGFLEAWLFTWLNPKAWVAVLGALAAFTTVGGSLMREVALVAAILSAFCLLSCVIWTAFGTAIGRYLARPRVRTGFNATMALLLVASLIPVFL